MGVFDKLRHSWNAFMNKDPTVFKVDYGAVNYSRPDRMNYYTFADKSIVASVYNRIAMDVASVAIQHVYLDENGRYIRTKTDSGINNCLTLEANKDQTGSAFIQDLVYSMLSEGYIAGVPIDVDVDPTKTDSYEIETMRVAKIKQWFPDHIKVEAYDDRIGEKKDLIAEKRTTAVIENPFYMVMNEPNSTGQRLTQKLGLLDSVDSQLGSKKLNLIIQLPYAIKSTLKRQQADQRKTDLENQLVNSQYGIAYADASEKITQLNRPLENNLLKEIEYLTNMFFGQLGITPEIMNGTADEKTMTNYYKRTIEPILSAICNEFNRKFLTKTARTQGQSIVFFMDPFKLVTTSELPELADKLVRNQILTPNEVRQIVGMKPAEDPKADELRNPNISEAKDEQHVDVDGNVIDEQI